MRALLIVLSALLSAGCASIYSVTHQNDVYGGVRLDGRILGAAVTNGNVHCGLENCNQTNVWFMSWGAVCDLPLSFVTDTLLLPYTAVAASLAKQPAE